MANPAWIDGSDDWTTVGDWSTGAQPAADDNVAITEGATQVTSDVGAVATLAVDDAGQVDIQNLGSLTVSGAVSNTGEIAVDGTSGQGGARLTVLGSLTNGGTLSIGNSNLSAADTVTVGSLVNAAASYSAGYAPGGSINLVGGAATAATLIVNAAAGFGQTGVLTGDDSLQGDALLQFADDEISSIAQYSELSLAGADAFVADAGETGSNSALKGLASNAGILSLGSGATIGTTGAFVNTGTIELNFGQSGMATLDIGGMAGLGGAGVLQGTVYLGDGSGAGRLEFSSGEITTILDDSSLYINGATSFVADDDDLSSNSALTGLASNAGTLTLQGGATIITSGSFANSATGTIDLSGGTLDVKSFGGGAVDGGITVNGGGLLEIGVGGLTSIADDGNVSIAGATSFVANAGATGDNSALGSLASNAGTLAVANGASVITSGAFVNSGSLSIDSGSLTTGGAFDNAATGSIDLMGGGTSSLATLIVEAAAGLGALGKLDGQVALNGDASIEFASGGITEIAADGSLTLSGANNDVDDADDASPDSALTGLDDNAGTLALEEDATLATDAALTNAGTVALYSGATLATGALDNLGTVSFVGGTYTVNGALDNSDSIDLNTSTALVENQASSLLVHSVAGFGNEGVLTGQVDLQDDALIQFDSGQIAAIAAGASLTLGDSTAYIADEGETTSNSALDLSNNAGTLVLENGATVDTSDALTNAATGVIELTNFFTDAAAPTLDIDSAAGFGTAGVVEGTVIIGNGGGNGGLLEFANGQITNIADDGSLSIIGANAFLADADDLSSSSALALASNAGTFSLADGVSMTTPGALDNTGALDLDDASLTINSAAGFGTAGEVTGQVTVDDSQLIFADGGEITSVAAGASLLLEGSQARFADAGAITDDSALNALTQNDGTINLEDGASATFASRSGDNAGDQETTPASMPITQDSTHLELFNSKTLALWVVISNVGVESSIESNAEDSIANEYVVIGDTQTANSSLPVMNNTGTIDIGNVDLREYSVMVVNGGLVNTGSISLTGNPFQSAFSANLDIDDAAGLGTTGVLSGKINLSGYAVLEFSSGQITSVAANSSLSINGANAFVSDATAITSDSALALTDSFGTFALSDDAAYTVAAGVTLSNTGAITLDADPNTYGEGGSTLTVDGALASSGTITIGNGGGSGTTVNGAGVLSVTGGVATINAGAAVSVATLQIAGPGTLDLAGGAVSSPIAFAPGAGGTLKIDAAYLASSGGAFANAITGFAAADMIDLAAFSYDGPTTVVLGPTDTLTLDGAAAQTVALTFDDADVGATFTMSSDGGDGTFVEIARRTQVDINGYKIDDDVSLSDDLFNIAMGATLVLLGTDALTGDAVEGSGRVSDRAAATIDGSLTLSGSALFVDMDSATETGGNLLLGQSVSDAVTARVISGAVWAFSDGTNIIGEGSSQFVNLGQLLLEGATTIDANFYDREGRIEIGGTADFASPGLVNHFIDDSITNLSDDSGTIELNGGVLVGSTVSTSTADLVYVRIVGDVTISSATVDIGTLNLGAGSVVSLTNAAATLNLGGEIFGAGALDIHGDDNVSMPDTSAGTALVGDVSLANYGDTTITGDDGVQFLANPWAGDQVTIYNEAGATWTDVGGGSSLFQQNGQLGSSVFINNGTFIEGTPDGVLFDMPVVNDDVIEAAPGLVSSSSVFTFDDSATGAGTIEIGVNDVTLDNSVGSGQTLNFNAGTGNVAPTLTLNDPQDFAGTLAGFDRGADAGDKLVLNTSVWRYQDYVSNGSGGSLMLTNSSGAEAAVDLSGVYDPTGFHAAVSGSTTTITYIG